ncbi:hypothetical protein [Nocardioides sp. SYSU DS0663]|uniref:hypothetical protein n=1 Tax=Nocardioides sp. SYSU DS0663 TaxID=3416445 RepID=UPI003F4BB062
MARFLRTLVALVMLVVPTVGLVGSSPAAAAPSYGPWSSPVGDLQGRVSPPAAKQARAFVQLRRVEDSDGERQVRLAYRMGGKQKTVYRGARDLAPGARTRYHTAKVRCGGSVLVIAQARYRADASADWSQWYEVSSRFSRAC